jgi:hypothetical protein
MLSSAVGFNIRPTMELNLASLIDMGFEEKLGVLTDIRNIAAKGIQFSWISLLTGMKNML